MPSAPLQTIRAYVRAFATLRADQVVPFYSLPCTFIRPNGVWVVQDEETATALVEHLFDHARSAGYGHSVILHATTRRLAPTLAEVFGGLERLDARGDPLVRIGFSYILREVFDQWRIVVAMAHDSCIDIELTPDGACYGVAVPLEGEQTISRLDRDVTDAGALAAGPSRPPNSTEGGSGARVPRRHLIERFLAAYNAFDIDGMLACVSPDVRFENYSRGERNAVAEGKYELRLLAERSVAMFSEREQRALSMRFDGDTAIVSVSHRARLAVDLPTGAVAGSVVEHVGRSEYTFGAGGIKQIVDHSWDGISGTGVSLAGAEP